MFKKNQSRLLRKGITLACLAMLLGVFSFSPGWMTPVRAANCYDECAADHDSCTFTLGCLLLGMCEHCDIELDNCMDYCDLIID